VTEDDFPAFVLGVQSHMHNLALALTGGNVHEAKDLVQSSLERIWARWHRLEVKEPHAYMRVVVAREFATSRRRHRWRREQLSADLPEQLVPDFADGHAESALLLRALSALPARQREVVVMRYLEDVSTADVAAALGCSEGSVKRSAYDGIRALRTAKASPTERT
jgi:RNA polymerase sigma-70 factor (sigma-E family)